jgi:hypothetical protein
VSSLSRCLCFCQSRTHSYNTTYVCVHVASGEERRPTEACVPWPPRQEPFVSSGCETSLHDLLQEKQTSLFPVSKRLEDYTLSEPRQHTINHNLKSPGARWFYPVFPTPTWSIKWLGTAVWQATNNTRVSHLLSSVSNTFRVWLHLQDWSGEVPATVSSALNMEPVSFSESLASTGDPTRR